MPSFASRLVMIMAEVLSTSPAYSSSHGSRFHFSCINCSAYFNWRLKMNRNCPKNHASLRTAKQKVGESFLLCKSNESRKLCGIPSKVASLDESVCGGESVMEEEELIDESDSKNIMPPWGGVAGQETDDHRSSLDGSSTISLEADGGSMDEMYYLEERDEEVLSKRILNLSRGNKVRSALALYRSMDASGLLPNSHACNSLLSSLLRNRRLDDAMKVFEFMKSSDIVTGHTYSLILKAVANLSSSDAALSVFEEVESDARLNKRMDAVVYNTMIAIFGKVNDWLQAKRMWRSMRENGCVGTAVTYRMLISIFIRCNQNELALDAYHEMLQSGLNPSDDAMQATIGACSREGKWDTALEILKTMLKNDMKPSLITCNALINSLGREGKVELSLKVFNLLKSLGYEPDSYTWNGLLCALNRGNRHYEALDLFERIRKEQSSVLNMYIYNTCLMSCQSLGLWERAMQLLWEMEGSDLPVSVKSYNLVIGACEAARKPKFALQVYDHMVQQKQKPDLFTLLSLIRSCIWGSLWDEIEEILNGEADGSLYNAAIQGLCLRKERDLARKLYWRMQKIGLKPDTKTWAFMLQNLPRP